MKNYVIFGTGVIFTKYISKIRESVNVIACLDNNEKKHWTKIDNIPIYPVGEIKNLNYEKIILLVNPQNAIEIKNQLCSLGVDANRILFYERFVAEISENRYEVYSPKVSIQNTKNKNWINCRFISEILKNEKRKFLYEIDEYDGKNQYEKEKLLAKNLTAIVSYGNGTWKNIVLQADDNEK